MLHMTGREPGEVHVSEIRLSADGWPPAKNEALSIFNREHGQRDRVRSLLEAAQRALSGTDWSPHEQRAVGLELIVVEAPKASAPADATNYLGGVADVLQVNRRNADLSHFGDAASASLYLDDRQVREVRYAVEQGNAPGYRVRVWLLSD